jgi:hypothetical protein
MSRACDMQALVDAHFARTITPADERALRPHLGDCEPCRARYRRQLLLARLDPEAPSPEERIASGLALGPGSAGEHESTPLSPPGRLFRLVLPAATVVAAAAAVLMLVGRPDPGDGFAARGGARDASAWESSAASPPLRVYRVVEGAPPVPVTGSVGRDDELAFAYENTVGKKYVMIFGVDENGRAYWFHPAWIRADEEPRAIEARKGGGLVTLPDAISHAIAGTQLDVHALFVDEPLTVKQAEARLAAGTLATSGAVHHVQRFEITP